MDEKTLGEINQRFAAIAMQMEDILPELLEPLNTEQAAISTLKQLGALLDSIANKVAHIQRTLGATT